MIEINVEEYVIGKVDTNVIRRSIRELFKEKFIEQISLIFGVTPNNTIMADKLRNPLTAWLTFDKWPEFFGYLRTIVILV